MKIKNLLLLAFMAICSMNAFAQNPYKANGIVYYLNEGTLTAVVQGVQPETLTDSKKDLEIPKTVTYDGKTYKVTGFRSWSAYYEYTPGNTKNEVRWFKSVSSVPTYEMENIQGKIEKLTVNIDNFTPSNLDQEDFRITSLKEIVFKGKHTGDLNVPEIETENVTFEVFDMSGVEVESGVLTYNGSASAGSGDYAGTLKVIKFPKEISINDDAFKDNVVVEEVEAGGIGASAFKGATSLKSIKVLGTEIGNNAFNGCSALATAEMNKVQTIGENAFVGTIIPAATLPEATTIGASAFKGVTTLTSATFPKATLIGASAFEGCTGITALELPATLIADDAIGADAFKGMTALATLTVKCKKINGAYFSGDNALATLNLDEVETIAENAFKGLTGVTAVTFPKAKEIGASAFEGCTGVTALELPATLTTIGADAFKGMTGLTTLTANCEAIGGAYFADDAALATLTLTGVKTIANNAFKGLTGVTTVTIPAATSIGASAFEGCTGVTAVTLPATLTTVGANVFKGTGITELTLPENLDNIAVNAFAGMTALTTVTANCATIGGKYFDGDTSLATLNLAKVTTIATKAFEGLSSVTTATFPKAVEIGAEAFKGTSITELTLPACLVTIADDAFAGMASLETVTAECATVGKYFTGDNALATLNLTGVTEIKAQAFKDLGSVTAVTFATGDPAPAVKINSEAFYGTGIAKLNLPANIEFAVGATDVFANMKKLKTLNAKCATIDAYFTGDVKLATLKN